VKNPPKTPAQRQADRDVRMREQGKVQKRVWAKPEHWPDILEFVAKLDEKI
jgi:hypothetical protein